MAGAVGDGASGGGVASWAKAGLAVSAVAASQAKVVGLIVYIISMLWLVVDFG